MIDFTLSPSQQAVREMVSSLSTSFLSSASKTYSKPATQDLRFQALKPFYQQATKLGLIKKLIPSRFGGNGGSLIEAAIMAEEMGKIDRSLSLTIFATGGGLGLLLAASSEEQKRIFLKPFFEDSEAPLASLVHSEPQGTANYLEKGGKGLQTVARRDGNDWVIDGEKMWATNCTGWDDRGADLQCVVCRYSQDGSPQDPSSNPADNIMILAVTREDVANNDPSAYRVLKHIPTSGFTSTSSPYIGFASFRVPAFNLLAEPGKGAALLTRSVASSAALAGALATGIMAATFEAALDFAKRDDRGGAKGLLGRQSVTDLLMDVKMRTDAARSLTWKACHALESGLGPELALESKIFCTEMAVRAVTDAMMAVGVSSLDTEGVFPALLNDAMLLPLSQGGNVGVRRRQLEELISADGYQPWASTYNPST